MDMQTAGITAIIGSINLLVYRFLTKTLFIIFKKNTIYYFNFFQKLATKLFVNSFRFVKFIFEFRKKLKIKFFRNE